MKLSHSGVVNSNSSSNINSQQQSTAVTAMASTVNNSNRAMVIVAIEAQDSLRAKYLENAYSVAMSTLAAEAFREQSTPGASEMLGVKNEDPKQVKRLVFWQCRASKLSVKLSGKNKKHCNTYHPYQTYTQTHIQRQRHRHTYSDTQRAPLSVTIL